MIAMRRPEMIRWAACFTLAAAFHAAGAAALLARWSDDADTVGSAPVIMVELAPIAATPQTKVSNLAVGPEQTEAEKQTKPEKPVEKLQLPEDKRAEPLPVIEPKPDKPKEKKPKREHQASLTTAPNNVQQHAERTTTPAIGMNSANPDAVANWRSAVAAALERAKRYPSDAQGAQGTAVLAFSIDRGGSAHNARITRSSGSSALDRETLAMVSRAQPFPLPPANMGAQVTVGVPIRYTQR